MRRVLHGGVGPRAKPGDGRSPSRREAPRAGEAERGAKGPAEQGWGPDGSAGGAGRHAPG
jgi:hypothetical protein